MSYLILFDIRELDNATRLKVNRWLHRIDAQMVQQSVWESESLSDLRNLAKLIESARGKALVLEKKVVTE